MGHIKYSKGLGILTAFFTSFCLLFQFFISSDKFINTISYFTIISNLLIVISLAFSIMIPKTRLGAYFSTRSIKTAIAVYIFIVGLIYNVILRELIKPVGWQLFLDNMLHVTTPMLYIFYWFVDSTIEKLSAKKALTWLLFPFAYLVYSLVRGVLVDWYPYPFIAVNHYGYIKVFLNIILITSLFYLFSLIFILINNRLCRKS